MGPTHANVDADRAANHSQQTVEQLARLYSQKDLVNDINVPIEVIKCVSVSLVGLLRATN